MSSLSCPVCGNTLKLQHRLRFNVYKCTNCSLLHSDAQFEHSFQSDLEPDARDSALKVLRVMNFMTIITRLKTISNKKMEGLEIGSGNGWWLEVCARQGIQCLGIEPERTYERYHQDKNLDMVYGFYPDVRPEKKDGYGFIIFNDVFEHIPDINSLVENVKKDLADDGMLIINIPMSTGFFYRLSTLLHRFGFNNSLTRMWQFNFHSPHMNYFNESNMKMLLEKHDCSCIDVLKLKSIDLQSTKDRMLADRSMSKWKASVMTSVLKLMNPIIQASKPDIQVFFFKKAKK